MTKQDIINYVTETPQNTNPAILNTMLDQLSSGDGDGGSSDMITLPKLTVTLNIDDTSHIDSWGLSAVGINDGFPTDLSFDAPQTTQVWEGYVLPTIFDSVIYPSGVFLGDESYNGYYSITLTNMVNCTEQTEAEGSVFITDPSQPASFTADAVYTPY